MTVKTSVEAGLAAIQAHAVFLDRGLNNATVVFYSDQKPADVTVLADESAKLVTCTLPRPCFKSLGANFIELHQTDAATVLKAGVALWARVFNGEGLVYVDLEVGSSITLANPDLALGSTLMINNFKIRPNV